jgi:hypothetical protein
MNENYINIIQWCLSNPKFSFWITIFSFSLILLWLIYLILTNFRLHAYIGSLKIDKDRLMQEKDLIRLGKSIQEPQGSRDTQ